MSKLFRRYNTLLVFLILVENYTLLFYPVNLGQQWLNAICYFLSSLLIGIVIIGKFKNKEIEKAISVKLNPRIGIPVLLLFIWGIYFLASADHKLFHEIPIDPARSDIIPSIQVLVKRLLHGVPVYQPIEDFGYRFSVTYLPLQWIIFTPAEIFDFDYRWVAFFIWLIAVGFVLVQVFQTKSTILQILVPLMLWGVYYLIFRDHNDVISNTIETMIAGYYMMLILSLNQKNALLQGLAITLCLLSRYSLVLWLPLWAFVLFLSNNRKNLWKTIITVIGFVVAIYVIPFLSKDWHSFMEGYNYYTGATIGEWRSINESIGKPYHLSEGVGIAFLYWDHYRDHLAKGVNLLRYTHLFMCLLTVFLLGVWYWRNRKRMQHSIFLMASFKIYLSVFLFFVQIPYPYLMIVGNFVSITIFALQWRYKIKDYIHA